MFTGLVRDVGKVASFDGGRLVVESATNAEPGDSIAVYGVCLTVVGNGDGRLAFDVVPETLDRVKPFGARVNLEPALRAGEPLGGHYVQGHVDGVGAVRPSSGTAKACAFASSLRPSCSATSSRRARSRSTACR